MGRLRSPLCGIFVEVRMRRGLAECADHIHCSVHVSFFVKSFDNLAACAHIVSIEAN